MNCSHGGICIVYGGFLNLCVVVAVVVVTDATSDDDAPHTVHDDSLRSSGTAVCIPHNGAL